MRMVSEKEEEGPIFVPLLKPFIQHQISNTLDRYQVTKQRNCYD